MKAQVVTGDVAKSESPIIIKMNKEKPIEKLLFPAGRFQTWDAHKYDRAIFGSILLISLAYLFFVASAHGWQLNHFECGATVGEFCQNPFYKPVTWENAEFLPAGVYGFSIGPLFKSAIYVPIALFVLGFVVNHWVYNKGKPGPLKKFLDRVEE